MEEFKSKTEFAGVMGRRIKAIRLALGYTQAKLAAKLGVTEKTITNYESGYRMPDAFTLLIFSDKTGFPIDYIIKGDDRLVPNHYLAKIESSEGTF